MYLFENVNQHSDGFMQFHGILAAKRNLQVLFQDLYTYKPCLKHPHAQGHFVHKSRGVINIMLYM